MNPLVAYFAAEYAISDDLPTYAGGLGVLAGDIIRQAGADGRNLIALGPAYRHNVAVKTNHSTPLDSQLRSNGFELLEVDGAPLVTTVDFHNWSVQVRAWERRFGSARLLLIDTDFEPNTHNNRNLTANLYDPDVRTRLLQQYLLAAAGVTILRRLGLEPEAYHLNEGHMAFVPVVLAMEYGRNHPGASFKDALGAVSGKVFGTKHTILPGAGDFADKAMIRELFDASLQTCGFSGEDLFNCGINKDDPSTFSTTQLLINATHRASGVSKIHVVAEKQAHPDSALIPITNGIYLPGWQQSNLADVGALDDRELWNRHNHNRADLVSSVNAELGLALDPERLTVVWARRFAAYKRPTLLFTDPDRLAAILSNADRPMQLIISGNANESDTEGMEAMEAITRFIQRDEFAGRVAYLPHYVTGTTRRLAGGADLWLNTPVRGMEACGTSGMKAGANGALQFSTSDGWFDEVDGGSIGWILPEEQADAALYDRLEHEIAPMFYEREHDLPTRWVKKMRATIELIDSQFSAHRMLDDYYSLLYGLTPPPGASDQHA